MPTIIQTSSGSDFFRVPAHRVYLRENWTGEWEVEPYLYCEQAAKRASPETSTATLSYQYGLIQRPDRPAPLLFAPLSIEGFYVKIEIDQFDGEEPVDPILWYGMVQDRGDDVLGAPTDEEGDRVPTGKQTLACYGLENLLAREAIRSSTIETPSPPAAASEAEVNRPLGFNISSAQHADDAFYPNRSSGGGEKGSFIFAGDPTAEAQPWTSADIVEYLLAYRSPKNVEGNVVIPFALDGVSLVRIPNWDRPRLSLKSETVKELLDKLIDRKRLVSYYVDVDETETPNQATLFVFTFTQESLAIPVSYQNAEGGQTELEATLWANANTASLDFDEAFDVEIAQLKRTIQDQYDQVICRGARKGSVFSVSFKDETLEPDWDTGSLQDEYNAGASDEDDYPSLSALRQWRNQLFRSNDKYRRVFSWFRVPQDWDGKAGDGEEGDKNPAFPLDDEFETSDTFWRPGLVFRSQLALLSDHDYSGNNVANQDVPDDTPDASRAEPLRPMAWLKVTTADGETRYQHVEKLGETAKTDKHALGGAAFHCSLRMQDRSLGVQINVNGQNQHAIAKTDFEPVDFSDHAPKLDYRDNLICTVHCDHDSHVEAKHPPTLDPELEADFVRTLLIDMSQLEHGRGVRLDYLAPGTVVGLKDGKLLRSTTGGYIRDDRGRLIALAQVAYLWYSIDRQAFTLRYRQIDGQFQLGTLITEIGSGATAQAVNTPITSVEWDLVNSTTTITTGFAELDLLHF